MFTVLLAQALVRIKTLAGLPSFPLIADTAMLVITILLPQLSKTKRVRTMTMTYPSSNGFPLEAVVKLLERAAAATV
jgi:predicted transporter